VGSDSYQNRTFASGDWQNDEYSLTSRVLAWGEPRLRDLPWRRTRDPWHVLVSEVMLQQTQVPRVIPKWLAFIEQFPTPHDCARVPLADVLDVWHGLGYPRRARNLHLAAQQIDQRGSFPSSLDELLALPGVGGYTARAVLAFAFEQPAAVVDTNIARVLARVAGRSLTPRVVQAMADEALAVDLPWLWNQCLMDLGATLCRPVVSGGGPVCAECPLVERCAWHGVGPDPAEGSAGVSGHQSRFEGSDRQARGALMAALRVGEVHRSDVPAIVRRSPARAALLLDSLVADGLVECVEDVVRYPQ
jgi:A/G-specific adenine glycosylase